MKKRFLAIFIVVLMLFSQLTVFSAETSSEDKTSKITDELAEAMEQAADDEYIPIYIWLESYDDSMVYALLSKNLVLLFQRIPRKAIYKR